MGLRTVAVVSAVASVASFAPAVPRSVATTRIHSADAEEVDPYPPLADAEVVILHRSRSSLAAVAYELASSLRELEGVGVGVATDGDGADAKALQALKCVRTLTPADGMSGYDEALTSLFAQGDSTRRKILVDASSLTADAAAERAQTAKSLKVDALCIIGDALIADDGSGKRGELGNKDEALAPGLETAARALPEHRRHDAYAVDLCLAEHAWAAEDWGRARVACRRVLRAADRVCTKKPPPAAAVAVLERARADRGRAAPGDVNSLDSALSNGDFELASLLAEQIAARLDPPPDDDGPGEDSWV